MVKLSLGKNLICCKWVFEVKQNAERNMDPYKAILFATDISQKHNQDFEETFTLVKKHSTVRLLLSVAASNKMLVKHLDVKTASMV